MIEGLKPYPEYQESGQKWLGRFPTSWRIRRIKTVIREKDARTLNGKGTLLSLSRTRGLIARAEMTDKAPSARTLVGYKLYEPGEMVMNRMQAWSGMFGAGLSPGLVSPDYAVFRIIGNEDVRFLLARMKSPDLVAQFALASKGIGSGFNRLYSDKLGAIPITLPPPDEQAAIVRFLEHANRKIDGLIRAKRKLIGLLNEQKQAIIHRAVTRGLNPTAPLKPSGIPWLGDIPKHWEVQPLKMVCSIQSGVTLGKDYAGQSVEEYPYLRVANVQAGHAKLDVVKTLRVTKVEANRSMLRAGDVLMTEGGDPDKLGRGCVWEEQVANCLHQNHVFAVRLNQRKLDSCFLTTLTGMTYARAYFQMTAKQTTNLAATNKTKIGMFKVLLPPLKEQVEVLALINDETRSIDVAIGRTEREIALMQEYRTRLTAEVVTGKLDVRAAAAKLPGILLATDPTDDDTMEEPEAEDAK